jgi:hypothetical protein
MSASPNTPGTTLAASSAAEPFSFGQLERMAATVSKSGLFAVKTLEGALTLMLIAQAENVHPVQAMMDYDIIESKPVLKSSAMLTRFLRAGGQVEWLKCEDDCVIGKFTSPKGNSIVVTWDKARVEKAGLSTRANHMKFPMQMKRARCISEGIRAVYPVTMLYTPEEFVDNPQDAIDITPVTDRVERAMAGAATIATALTLEEVEEHVNSMGDAATVEALQEKYMAAFNHAKNAKDNVAKQRFDDVYRLRKDYMEQGKS